MVAGTPSSSAAFIDAQANNDSDRNAQIYSDLDLFFNKKTTSKDISKVTNIQAVKRSVRNLILTNHYEKPFHPEIYCGVRNYLFQPMNQITSQLIKKSIEDVINNYEPRVTINTVRVDPFEEKNLYNIIIVYSIVNDPNPVNIQELDFFLERTR